MAKDFQNQDDERTLAAVIDLAKSLQKSPSDENADLPADFENFISQVVRYATGEDKNWDEPETLLDRAQQAWTASATRKPGEHILSLRTEKNENWKEQRLVLDIIADDMPFLVDSVSAALSEAGKPVSFFVNAVVNTSRDNKGARTQTGGVAVRESMIHAEMDPPMDDNEMQLIEHSLANVLNDVAIAVRDWEPMRARLGACIAQLERTRPAGIDRNEQRESVAFLKWLWDNRFAFLGVRHYEYQNDGQTVKFHHAANDDLGILRDPNRRVLKSTYSEEGHLSPTVEDFMKSGEPILIAKANAISLVHRRVYMDYIGIKTYSTAGDVTGEYRFVGLLTSDAYNRPASDIPLLRAKVQAVIDSAQFSQGGHNENAILNILETYPRDEMFQIDIPTLTDTALGILRLYKRPRVKVFIRRDRFDRFISSFVYIPRDRFNSDVREAIGNYLAKTFNGRVSAFYPSFGDVALIRVHYIIGIDPGAPEGPSMSILTRNIRALCREWADDLQDTLRTSPGTKPTVLFQRYEKAFDAGYREKTTAREALDDIQTIETLGSNNLKPRVFRRAKDKPNEIRIKLYTQIGALKLSALIPTLENLGLFVLRESSHPVTSNKHKPDLLWIHDIYSESRNKKDIDVDAVKEILENAISEILGTTCEDDPYNGLIMLAHLDWRETWILRAVGRYLMQTGIPYSQTYIAEVLTKHPSIVRDLIAVFHARFNPSGPIDAEQRQREVATSQEKVFAALESVSSLDEDKIIRRFLNVFDATIRTNFYQPDLNAPYKAYISFKIDSAKIEELPEPVPFREIFVSGPRVDGVHLRFGPVARGGLRWSDRREDFRTEVLGLVKAQRVKNAVIVPTGSKGGFYPKQLPVNGDRNEVYEEGREAYKIFIRGLLDLTDNIVDSKIVSPPSLVRWDAEDPYLVVAADKGTAAFSDTANSISEEYGFWLGDAFASGGSAGYDHKVMGITARGAWEAVKRHFREMNKDIQSEPFTVAGVGDMSGDVFGNGMLLSQQIKLVAAFDHRDIFIDPNPDVASSFAERKRLFETPRTSWKDYNKKLISAGGGVFDRSAKSISLSSEIKALLKIEKSKLTPNQLIREILKANVELFWLGGIGTYFKSENEDNWQVGDRANDPIRIDATEIGAKVIGEGANLGLTQIARIEYAHAGGKINTDAIDNSAGVDSSDHEVNIKILLTSAIEKGELKREDRNALLTEMTEDVAKHVLIHNYEQTRAISQLEFSATSNIDAHARLISAMEKSGRLDRSIEDLPSSEQILSLKGAGRGLSRPELSVLLAYAKNWLFEELVQSPAPDDPALEQELFFYFPKQLHRMNSTIISHRLRREIIATRLANEIIDTCGPSFPYRTVEATGVRFSDIALAYEGARRILNLNEFADEIGMLDCKIAPEIQIELYNSASNLLREQMYRIASGAMTSVVLEKRGIDGLTKDYADTVGALKAAIPDVLPAGSITSYHEKVSHWIAQGVPEKLANEASLMNSLDLVFEIANLAKATAWPIEHTATVFYAIGDLLKIDAVRDAAKTSAATDYYDKLAIRRLTEDLAIRQSAIASSFIHHISNPPDGLPSLWVGEAFNEWQESEPVGFNRYYRFIEEIEIKAGVKVAKLSLLNRKLFDLEERLRRD